MQDRVILNKETIINGVKDEQKNKDIAIELPKWDLEPKNTKIIRIIRNV